MQIKKNQSLCFVEKMQVIVPLKQKKIAADSQLRCSCNRLLLFQMKSSDSGATGCCCRLSSSDGVIVVKGLGGMRRSSLDSHVFVLRWCLERNLRILLLKMLSNLV